MAQGTVWIDRERCKGCGLCPTVCPKDALEMDLISLNAKGYHPAVLINEAACTGCAICAVICPDVCITVAREAKPARV
ncbi:MAG: 4Fe-4S binding protein [Chloroflexi bacterium]|nr:4Fe-4S binding protein [Chloroflexota bacterium]